MRIPIESFDERTPRAGNEVRANMYYMHRPQPRTVVMWKPVMSRNFHTPERFGIVRLVN